MYAYMGKLISGFTQCYSRLSVWFLNTTLLMEANLLMEALELLQIRRPWSSRRFWRPRNSRRCLRPWLATTVLTEDRGCLRHTSNPRTRGGPSTQTRGRGRGCARDSGCTSSPKRPRNFIPSTLPWEKLDTNTDWSARLMSL